MKHVALIMLMGVLFISCAKQHETVVPPARNSGNDTDTVYVPVVVPPDTNYFDSLRRNFEGVSRYQDDSLLVYQEGPDLLAISVTTYSNGETRLTATCDRLSVEFVLPDSLKKEMKFTLEQWNDDHSERLEVDFSHQQYARRVSVFQTWPSTKGIVMRYFFSHK